MKAFRRTDAHKKKRLHDGWRKPKGIQNKMRLEKKGYASVVKPGYRSPLATRDTVARKPIVIVRNLTELLTVDPKKQAVELACVGRAKKEELIAKATELKITLVNLSVKRYTDKSKAILAEKKEKKDLLEKKKAKKVKAKEAEKAEKEKAEKVKADALSAAEEKKAKEAEKSLDVKTKNEAEELSEKDRKVQEKKELDKVLTSKKGY